MDLKTYLKRSKQSQSEFAEKLGVSQGLVSQWVQGITGITPERAIEIEDATAGVVTRHELRPDIFGRSPQRGPQAKASCA